jgi:hypothetical protein
MKKNFKEDLEFDEDDEYETTIKIRKNKQGRKSHKTAYEVGGRYTFPPYEHPQGAYEHPQGAYEHPQGVENDDSLYEKRPKLTTKKKRF